MEAILRELEAILAGANYFVDFSLHQLPSVPTWAPEQYIVAGVGPKPPVTKVAEVALPELLAEVEHYLRYDRGQYAHLGPGGLPHQSERFGELLASLRHSLASVAAASTTLIRFERDDPIEWQFSFLFIEPCGALVFIGYGSD